MGDSTRVRARGRGRHAVALSLAGVTIVTVASLLTAASAGASIDTSSAQAVTDAYQTVYVPAMNDSVQWTGSINGCNAGTTSSQSQQKTLDIINFDRQLAGLDPITLDGALSAKAQAAALVMSANNALTHDVPSNWTCYTSTAHAAAASSDLYLGQSGAKAIAGYMVDPGSANSAVGHRRWILYPPTRTMGTGSTESSASKPSSNALYVFGKMAGSGYSNPRWVGWPSKGYFPAELEPNGKWSLSGSVGHTWNFGHVTIRVTDSKGHRLTVKKYAGAHGYGADTLVFQVSGLTLPSVGGETDYTVSVTGVRVARHVVSTTYTVKFVRAPGS